MAELKGVTAAIGARLTATVADKALSFVVFAYAGSRLGPELFGAYAFGVAINAFAILLADLGVLQVLIRRLSRDQDSDGQQTLRAAIVGKLILSLGAAGAGWTYAVWSTGAQGMRLVTFAALVLGTFQGVADTATGNLVAAGRQGRVAWAEFLNRFVWALACALSLTVLHGDLAVAGMGFGLLLGVAAQMLGLGRSAWPPEGGADLIHRFRSLVREGRPLLIQGVATTVSMRADVLILMLLLGLSSVGLYSAAVRLSEPPVIIAGIVASVLFPVFVRAERGARQESLRLLTYGTELTYWVVVGATLLYCLASTELLDLVFGRAFVPAGGALRWLALALVPLSANVMIQQALVARGAERTTVRLSLASAAVSVVVLLGLAPRLGIAGAGLASLLGYGAFSAVGLALKLSRQSVLAAALGLVRPLCTAALGFGAASLVPAQPYRVAVGLAVYLFGALVVGRLLPRLIRPLEQIWATQVVGAGRRAGQF